MMLSWMLHSLIFAGLLIITSAVDNPYNEESTLSKPLPISINVEDIQNSNRTNSEGCHDLLTVHFALNGSVYDIRLVLASGIHGNRIPVFLSSPENVLLYNHSMGVHLCYYNDIYSSASFSVQKVGSSYILDGHFRNEGNLYAITAKGHKGIINKSSQTQNEHHIQHFIQHLSSGDIHRPPLESSRLKRQAKTQYNVGVLVVVDNAIFKRWYALSKASSNQEKLKDAVANIRYYFSHIINEVNTRYQSIQDADYNVNVYLVGFSIARSVADSPWTEEGKINGDKINVFEVIKNFRAWVNQRASQLPAFDHAILFTGNDLYATTPGGEVSSSTTGQSYVGGICRYDRVSVVEDKSRYKSATTAAHEIGHNIGAGHDGQDNSCSASAQFVMTPIVDARTPENYYNIFTFSSCSKTELKRTLTSIAEYSDCLNDRPDVYDESEWRKYLDILPGQKYSYDIQCQNIYGEGSYFCGTQSYGEKICQSMTCHYPEKDDCFIPSDTAAAHGTTCGDKKWCDSGHCVRDDRAPSVNPDCIFGDYKGLLLNKTVTCKDMIERYPHYCYYQTNRELCCASCARVYQGENVGCEYGDHADWCKTLPEDNCKLNAEDCCVSCSTSRTTTEGCEDEENSNCITMEPNKCYDLTERKKCCRTCESIRRELRLPFDCPYGNKDPSCSKMHRSNCYYVNFSTLSKCCEKCQRINIPGCEYGDRVKGCDRSDNSCWKNSACCETCEASTIPMSILLLALSLSLAIYELL